MLIFWPLALAGASGEMVSEGPTKRQLRQNEAI
jgi:hypothetical protein